MITKNQNESSPGIADIFQKHSNKLSALSKDQYKVINAITSCRTEKLGGHVYRCDSCGEIEIFYNSCRNRHCPTCQYGAKEKWIATREAELLPVPYFHLVFTVPDLFYEIALQNKKLFFNLLFKASSETLKEVALRPANLGALIGFISILHTWTQKLLFHPHIHCIVPGGGLSRNKDKWVSSKKKFFLAVRILSKVFRGKFLSALESTYNHNALAFYNDLCYLKNPESFKALLKKAAAKNWVVYSKKSFGGPKQVFKYLGNYTHRVAISNHRIVSMTEKTVSFRWKDRRNENQQKTLTIPVVDFMKRFLLHILPSGFVKIRYYGILGNPCKKLRLELCLLLIGIKTKQHCEANPVDAHIKSMKEPFKCPHCQKGKLILINEIPSKGHSPPFRIKKAG